MTDGFITIPRNPYWRTATSFPRQHDIRHPYIRPCATIYRRWIHTKCVDGSVGTSRLANRQLPSRDPIKGHAAQSSDHQIPTPPSSLIRFNISFILSRLINYILGVISKPHHPRLPPRTTMAIQPPIGVEVSQEISNFFRSETWINYVSQRWTRYVTNPDSLRPHHAQPAYGFPRMTWLVLSL